MKISDIIENFILEVIGDENVCDINRNELASYFKCAPSQINYVLQTRFTLDRGYQIESQRGGGGYIRIEKIQLDREPYLYSLLQETYDSISFTRLKQIVENMVNQNLISIDEGNFLTTVTSDKALSCPSNIADTIRSNILRECILHLLKR